MPRFDKVVLEELKTIACCVRSSFALVFFDAPVLMVCTKPACLSNPPPPSAFSRSADKYSAADSKRNPRTSVGSGREIGQGREAPEG